MENWVNIIVSICSGLAVCIPVVIKLVQYVQAAVKEKNWGKLVQMTINYMTEAETKFTDGATKKEWCMSMVKASAKSINYDLDDDSVQKISDMIDSFCMAAKTINTEVNASAQ